MKKLLIIEDNEGLREQTGIFLNNNGFKIEYVEEYSNIEKILSIKADMILLDLTLPGVDGLYICSEIRKKSDIPIIIITSKNTEIDELLSMNVGGDDFITKPFNTQILLARINNIFRRLERKNNSKIKCRDFEIDLSKSVIIKEDEEVELTKNELKILHVLIENKGKIVSRDDIMTYLWDSEMFIDDNTLTVNINRLRTKLDENGIENLIETRRGQGYIIE